MHTAPHRIISHRIASHCVTPICMDVTPPGCNMTYSAVTLSSFHFYSTLCVYCITLSGRENCLGPLEEDRACQDSARPGARSRLIHEGCQHKGEPCRPRSFLTHQPCYQGCSCKGSSSPMRQSNFEGTSLLLVWSISNPDHFIAAFAIFKPVPSTQICP